MRITPDLTIGEIAAAFPETVRIFEAKDIDYCCGGKYTLETVCQTGGFNQQELVADLEGAAGTPSGRPAAWTDFSLSELIQHIVTEHHASCRFESARLLSLLDKVVAQHGVEHPELEEARSLFSMLSMELSRHMGEEEQILFPFIEFLEHEHNNRQAAIPASLGSIDHPIHQMTEDHDDAGGLAEQIREVTGNYAVPETACNSYRALLLGLAEFERDLHRHVHLENNVLFPRARSLERAA